mmetsp:Transcript_10362/g.23379  ORF Transcript_10362/g.23379 Transcript_10362/m.23379 type:complete len:1070 (-) Transcript_10362:48-3257(-)
MEASPWSTAADHRGSPQPELAEATRFYPAERIGIRRSAFCGLQRVNVPQKRFKPGDSPSAAGTSVHGSGAVTPPPAASASGGIRSPFFAATPAFGSAVSMPAAQMGGSAPVGAMRDFGQRQAALPHDPPAFDEIDRYMTSRGLNLAAPEMRVNKENAPIFHVEHRQSGSLSKSVLHMPNSVAMANAAAAAPTLPLPFRKPDPQHRIPAAMTPMGLSDFGVSHQAPARLPPAVPSAEPCREILKVSAGTLEMSDDSRLAAAPRRVGREAWRAQLSQEQSAAAEAPFHVPLLVLAGPGSGKTAFLVARVARCLSEGVCSAERVAVVTFTARAAQELLIRVRQRSKGNSGSSSSGPWVGTMHALALRLLRETGSRAARVASEEDRRDAGRRCLAEYGGELRALLGLMQEDVDDEEAGDEDDATGQPQAWPSRSGADSNPRSPLAALLRILRRLKQNPERWSEVIQAHPSLGMAVKRFSSFLSQKGLLDIADIVPEASRLLEGSARARQWAAAHVEHLFVDEWQDTDEMQVIFLRQLLHGAHTVSAVGDDDQQIYSWRKSGSGTTPAEGFKRAWPAAHIATLGTNFRSSQEIVRLSSRLIDCNLRREKKLLTSARKEKGCEVPVVLKPSAGAEASWVASEILRLRKDQAHAGHASASMDASSGAAAQRPWSSFAVLARTNAVLVAVEQAFVKLNVPSHIARRSREFSAASTGGTGSGTVRPSGRSLDVLAYLRLAIDVDHDPSFLRVYNLPRRGLGKKALQLLRDSFGASALEDKREGPLDGAVALEPAHVAAAVASHPGQTDGRSPSCAAAMRRLLDQSAKVPAKVLQGFANFNQCLEAIRKVAASRCSAADVLQEVLKVTSFLRGESANDVGVAKLIHEASRYSPTDAAPNGAACVALLLSDMAGGGVPSQDSVTLSTIHGAKGLEWDVVFVLHCCENTLPLQRRAEENADHLEEERRLLYVAMTRARSELYLLCPLRDCYGNATEPSRFLHEVGLLDSSAAAAPQQPPGTMTGEAAPLIPGDAWTTSGFQSARQMLPAGMTESVDLRCPSAVLSVNQLCCAEPTHPEAAW